MDCPKCKEGYVLKPVKLEYSLPGLTCNNCHGVLMSLLNYRNWVEYVPENIEDKQMELAVVSPVDTKNALLCPKCKHIMTKYRIDLHTENRVDLCSYCDEAWLDDGEWKLLKQLELVQKLPDICSEPWQRHIHRDQAKENYEARFQKVLGDEDYEEMVRIKHWIDHHPRRKHIYFYLNKIADIFDE